MPNIPQQQTIVQYVANSSQTQYTFAFYSFNQFNINVYYQAPNATPVPSSDILALGSQYTVTFNADPTTGGTITLLFTPTTGYYLTIALNLIPSLNTNFANAQNFNGANLDAALDYLLMLCQQNLNYALERNLSYVINTYLPDAQPYTQLPPLAQNQIWVGSGAGIVAGTVSQVPSASLLQSLLANNAMGTAGANLVGYYDNLTADATTVSAFLQTVSAFMASSHFETFSGTDTGTVNNLALSITAPGFALTSFQVFLVMVSNTNTGASTLTINSGSAINIVDNANNPVTNNAMLSGQMCLFVYNGTNMQLINPNKIYYGASMTMNAAQTVNINATATILFNTAGSNPVGLVNTLNNGFKINKVGYYRVNINISCSIPSSVGSVPVNLVRNNATTIGQIGGIQYSNTNNPNNIEIIGSLTFFGNLNDIINLSITNGTSSNNLTVGSATSTLTNFDIEYLGM